MILTTLSLQAHPGRTASDGCHYCRTNCSYWGEVAKARHCHSGNSVEPDFPMPNNSNDINEVPLSQDSTIDLPSAFNEEEILLSPRQQDNG
ncbi:hypothetical protein D1Z90_19200 [Motilimonas pumila]|uniref:Uncharacterized protein n=2 Tax=Motilimonas pumila TaxID=2303987 RepID=A0A418Y9U9_9GAMM|nr:hypothetical protein D1Z90_19200 [Motilimonas pumila]